MSTAAELRQILKEDKAGKNLYDHLTETLMKLLIDKPTNAYDQFELISADTKLNPFDPDPKAGRAVARSAEEISVQLEWSKKCSALLKILDEVPEESQVKFPDLMEEAGLLEWAGINIGKAEVYRLYLSVKLLAESLPAEVGKLRYFGQISTTGKKPYVIIEGLNADEEEEGVDELLQEGKTGANKYSYWVAQSTTVSVSEWTKLPNVTMDQVVKGRQFKRFFTGDLEAQVPSYPPFPGVEKNFLRVQIARIVGETSISPDGFFELDSEEEPPVVREADVEALADVFSKSSMEFKDPDSWKHHEIALNTIGRVNALPEQTDANGDVIEEETPIDITEPLDSIKAGSWTFRICPGGPGSALGSCVVARSLVWPGAVSIYARKKFLNTYIGYGVMYGGKNYSPPLPNLIQSEWNPVNEEDEVEGVLNSLKEQSDVLEDPTVPEPEGEEEEEDE